MTGFGKAACGHLGVMEEEGGTQENRIKEKTLPTFQDYHMMYSTQQDQTRHDNGIFRHQAHT